ncbi:MAG TPA: hypothetical protein VHP80_18860 [Candidatus Acidoferrum sp.]|nr:hypothetical protein [Candidatus Acidoferrum sp.]
MFLCPWTGWSVVAILPQSWVDGITVLSDALLMKRRRAVRLIEVVVGGEEAI